MKTHVRYEKLIYAKLKYLQAKIEMRRAKAEIEKYITVGEAKNKNVLDREGCQVVMNNLLNRYDIKIEPKTYVQSTLKYKDVSIYLHDSKPYGYVAVSYIISAE